VRSLSEVPLGADLILIPNGGKCIYWRYSDADNVLKLKAK
jgi:hypothetical protein